MTPEEITALAREYAEEIVQDTDSNPELSVCRLNEMRKEVAEDFEDKLRFLLQRYCLVDKVLAKESYDYAVKRLKEKKYFGSTVNDRMYNEGELEGQIDLLESIFPEIAKDVEE